MTNPIYLPGADQQYNSRFITKLVRNFRSHPAILELPSRYGGQIHICIKYGGGDDLCCSPKHFYVLISNPLKIM